MHPIPQRPELLDGDRMLSDTRADMTAEQHKTRAERLEQALHESCAYATELWEHLQAARQYLYDSLPSDPRSPGASPHAGASPTGPSDEEGWARWVETYGTVTSILAGPQGDSGFGLREAQLTARGRRDAPNLRVLARATQPAGDAVRPTELAVARDRRSTVTSSALLGVLSLVLLRGLRRGRTAS